MIMTKGVVIPVLSRLGVWPNIAVTVLTGIVLLINFGEISTNLPKSLSEAVFFPATDFSFVFLIISICVVLTGDVLLGFAGILRLTSLLIGPTVLLERASWAIWFLERVQSVAPKSIIA